ncbi:MAG: helix-turn-helix domain-containing protein [bacterium]|nr:helix-turn-helix domain-containing protein [bacterium]
MDENKKERRMKLGSELRKARKEKQLTLEELSQKTRINLEYLEALEKDRFDFLNSPYVLAFLKTYSKTLGLDPEEIAGRFSEQIQTQFGSSFSESRTDSSTGVETYQPSLPLSDGTANPNEQIPQYKKGLVMMLAIIVFIVVIYVLKSIFSTTGNDRIITPTPTEQTITDPDSTGSL